jgi:hypothetical protein
MTMLSFDRITELASDAARELRITAEVVGTTPGGPPDGGYAEVIIAVAGSGDQARRVLVGLDRRQSPKEIKQQVRAHLLDGPLVSPDPQV